MNTSTAITSLPKFGPGSREILAAAGGTSIESVRKSGVLAACAKARRCGANASLKLPWAPEGTLTGLSWQEVSREHRSSLLLTLEQHERIA
jgi:DNA transformation protein and related proteins